MVKMTHTWEKNKSVTHTWMETCPIKDFQNPTCPAGVWEKNNFSWFLLPPRNLMVHPYSNTVAYFSHRAGGNFTVTFQKNLDHWLQATPVSTCEPRLSQIMLNIGNICLFVTRTAVLSICLYVIWRKPQKNQISTKLNILKTFGQCVQNQTAATL